MTAACFSWRDFKQDLTPICLKEKQYDALHNLNACGCRDVTSSVRVCIFFYQSTSWRKAQETRNLEASHAKEIFAFHLQAVRKCFPVAWLKQPVYVIFSIDSMNSYVWFSLHNRNSSNKKGEQMLPMQSASELWREEWGPPSLESHESVTIHRGYLFLIEFQSSHWDKCFFRPLIELYAQS